MKVLLESVLGEGEEPTEGEEEVGYCVMETPTVRRTREAHLKSRRGRI
jgi:hypothetical protein